MPRHNHDPFWSTVAKGLDGCWHWTGPVDDTGRVRVLVGGIHRSVDPRRWAWHLTHRGLDDDIGLRPACDTAGCLAPEHHQPVNSADNSPLRIIARRSDGTLIFSHRCLDHLDQISVAPPRWECVRCGRILDQLDIDDDERHR